MTTPPHNLEAERAVIRVFPRKTKWTPDDDLSFIGDPPLFRPEGNYKVMVSVIFTSDISEGIRLAKSWSQYYDDVQMGGPAINHPGGEFVPGMFIKHGVTITSRGCPHNCPWCYVPEREGHIRELKIKSGWILQDNNILACSRDHIERVFEMLDSQGRGIKFAGGLDARLFKPWHKDLIDKIRIDELWFACDSSARLKYLEPVSEILSHYNIRKKRCYVMVGFRDDILEAEKTLESVFEMGFMPFAQLYDRHPIKDIRPWKKLVRKWSRPAAYMGRKDG
jgi:hypothetical protein